MLGESGSVVRSPKKRTTNVHMVGRGKVWHCVIVPKALEAAAQKLRTARRPVVQVTVRRLLVR